MAFFKHEQGTSNLRLRRIEQAVWVLIYGGLIAIIVGYFMHSSQGVSAPGMYWAGGLAVALGVVLIYIRSRLHERPRDSAKPPPAP